MHNVMGLMVVIVPSDRFQEGPGCGPHLSVFPFFTIIHFDLVRVFLITTPRQVQDERGVGARFGSSTLLPSLGIVVLVGKVHQSAAVTSVEHDHSLGAVRQSLREVLSQPGIRDEHFVFLVLNVHRNESAMETLVLADRA